MHLLVDLENVQPAPADVANFIGAAGRAWVFYGPQSHRKLAALAAVGERVTMVPVARSGNNALDFHLVLYLGLLAERFRGEDFVVLSRDTDYDVAIEHARVMSFSVRRIESLQPDAVAKGLPPAPVRVRATAKKAAPAKKVPAVKKVPAAKKVASAKKQPREKTVQAVYQDALRATALANKPARLARLEAWIQARFGTEPAPEKVQAVLDMLDAAGVIRVDGGKLNYPNG